MLLGMFTFLIIVSERDMDEQHIHGIQTTQIYNDFSYVYALVNFSCVFDHSDHRTNVQS